MFVHRLVDAHSRPFAGWEYKLVAWLTALMFLGRAWQAIYFDLPIRELLWDEYWLKGIVEFLSANTWEHYVKNSDEGIQIFQTFLGVNWLLAGAWVFAFRFFQNGWVRKIGDWIFYAGLWWLAVLFFLLFKEMFWAVGQLLEYSLQMGVGFFWLYMRRAEAVNSPNFRFALQLCTAICFFSHGLYAYGYYPQPAAWIDWCIRVFFLSETQARWFLWVIGIVDMLKLGIIFIPFRPLQLALLWYCVAWGMMTALARLVANYSFGLPIESLFFYTPEFLVRLVHGGLPLLLVGLWHSKKQKNTPPSNPNETLKHLPA